VRSLKVQGKGCVSEEPDMVTLSFDVSVEVLNYEDCLHALNTRTESLRKNIELSGLDKTHLKTTSFRVRVKTQYVNGEHIFSGYSASHEMNIELPMDKNTLNKVLQHVADGHSNAEISITFSIKDKKALRKKVLTQAVQTAKENAKTLALAADVKLGELMKIDYGWSEVHIYDHQEDFLCQSISSDSLHYNADIEPENVKAEDNVTLIYEIVG